MIGKHHEFLIAGQYRRIFKSVSVYRRTYVCNICDSPSVTSGCPTGLPGGGIVKISAKLLLTSLGRFFCGHRGSSPPPWDAGRLGSVRGRHIGYAVSVRMVGLSSSMLKRGSALASPLLNFASGSLIFRT